MKKTIAKQLSITKFPFSIYDSNGNEIYCEQENSYWYKEIYDDNDKKVYFKDSNGFWYKNEYDSNGNRILFKNSDGYILTFIPNSIRECEF